MGSERSGDKASGAKPVSRRTFLGLGASALAAALAGCGRTAEAPSAVPTGLPSAPTLAPPTATPLSPADAPVLLTPLPPTYTPVRPTPTPPPTLSPVIMAATDTPVPELDRAVLTAHWPATATSRVVAVRHSRVWAGGGPEPAVVLQMLDIALGTLTDVTDVLTAWRALFDPGERVLLKVNCIAYAGPTQPAVTYAVAQRLQDAGVPVENILIFDRTDDELRSAGYLLNDGSPGVRCHGARGNGSEAALTQATVRFYQDLDTCDAIINIPIPKQHGTAGVSVALKNHYGSVNRPGALHGNRCDPAVAELNAQPVVRDRTRLVVGAALSVSPFDWNRPERENALLLSFDPVALDTVARDILVRHRQARNGNAATLIERSVHLATAQELGLGATDPGLIDLREVTLG